jgi:hypothetical protein
MPKMAVAATMFLIGAAATDTWPKMIIASKAGISKTNMNWLSPKRSFALEVAETR